MSPPTRSSDSWEARHEAWRASGNTCRQCEYQESRDERSLHRSPTGEWWSARALDGARWWDGLVLAVLRDRARLRDRRDRARTRTPEYQARAAEHRHELRRLKIAAEAADVTLDGIRIRGPVQSRPDWELELAAADASSRLAWADYALVLFRDVPSITGKRTLTDDAPVAR